MPPRPTSRTMRKSPRTPATGSPFLAPPSCGPSGADRPISRNEASDLRQESRGLERRLFQSGRGGLDYREMQNIQYRIARLEQHVRREASDRNGWGRGNFSPSSTSQTQLPRRVGLVREAPDCFASVVDCARIPPRETFFTPSTRLHSAPFTPGIP